MPRRWPVPQGDAGNPRLRGDAGWHARQARAWERRPAPILCDILLAGAGKPRSCARSGAPGGGRFAAPAGRLAPLAAAPVCHQLQACRAEGAQVGVDVGDPRAHRHVQPADHAALIVKQFDGATVLAHVGVLVGMSAAVTDERAAGAEPQGASWLLLYMNTVSCRQSLVTPIIPALCGRFPREP